MARPERVPCGDFWVIEKDRDFWLDKFIPFLGYPQKYNHIVACYLASVMRDGIDIRFKHLFYLYPRLKSRVYCKSPEHYVELNAEADCRYFDWDLYKDVLDAQEWIKGMRKLRDEGEITRHYYNKRCMREYRLRLAKIREQSRRKEIIKNRMYHPYNSYTALNPLDADPSIWMREHGVRTGLFGRANIAAIYNLLIDIDSDYKMYYPKKSLSQIIPVVQEIHDYFDRDLYNGDWKVEATSDWGNQVVIPIKPIVLTEKNRDEIADIIRYFTWTIAYGFSVPERYIYIDVMTHNIDRVFRTPGTWNGRKRSRAFPVTKDWTRYEDKSLWKFAEELANDFREMHKPSSKKVYEAKIRGDEKEYQKLSKRQDRIKPVIAKKVLDRHRKR